MTSCHLRAWRKGRNAETLCCYCVTFKIEKYTTVHKCCFNCSPILLTYSCVVNFKGLIRITSWWNRDMWSVANFWTFLSDVLLNTWVLSFVWTIISLYSSKTQIFQTDLFNQRKLVTQATGLSRAQNSSLSFLVFFLYRKKEFFCITLSQCTLVLSLATSVSASAAFLLIFFLLVPN